MRGARGSSSSGASSATASSAASQRSASQSRQQQGQRGGERHVGQRDRDRTAAQSGSALPQTRMRRSVARAMPSRSRPPVQRLPRQAQLVGGLREHAAVALQRGLDRGAVGLVGRSVAGADAVAAGKPRSAGAERRGRRQQRRALDACCAVRARCRASDARSSARAASSPSCLPVGRKCRASGRMSSRRSASGGSCSSIALSR